MIFEKQPSLTAEINGVLSAAYHPKENTLRKVAQTILKPDLDLEVPYGDPSNVRRVVSETMAFAVLQKFVPAGYEIFLTDLELDKAGLDIAITPNVSDFKGLVIGGFNVKCPLSQRKSKFGAGSTHRISVRDVEDAYEQTIDCRMSGEQIVAVPKLRVTLSALQMLEYIAELRSGRIIPPSDYILNLLESGEAKNLLILWLRDFEEIIQTLGKYIDDLSSTSSAYSNGRLAHHVYYKSLIMTYDFSVQVLDRLIEFWNSLY